MHTRAFGRESLRVSEIGLGTWQLGGDWGEITDAAADATLEAALASGVNFLDTADVYGAGRSEQRIARFLRRHPDQRILVATKLGRGADPGWPANFSRAAFRQHVDGSLRRLQVEALDLIQLHCVPTEVLREGACFDWLRELQAAGRIRRWGASVETMEEARLCLQQDGIASLQIIFNVLRQKPIDELFADARARGVALIIRLPLASGLLGGRLTRQTRFAPDDHRNYNRDGQAFNVGETFGGLPFETGLELVEELRALLPPGLSLPAFALRWILDFEAVTTVIPGARSPEQARANAESSALPPLDPALHERLRKFYRERVHQHIRGPY